MRTLVASLSCVTLLSLSVLGCGEGGAPQLSSDHPGWQRADCASCHPPGGDHDDGRSWDTCFGCHDGNGQPSRPAGHHDTDCTACHGTGGSGPWNDATHADYATWEASACLGCHEG